MTEMLKQIVIGATGGVIATILGAFVLWVIPGLVDYLFAPALPRNAVLAFATKKKCPTGWRIYEPARGRFILGYVGDGTIPNITNRAFKKQGGVETITLGYGNIPRHSHALPNIVMTSDPRMDHIKRPVGTDHGLGAGLVHRTSVEGRGEKFAAMPPYVVLRFCTRG